MHPIGAALSQTWTCDPAQLQEAGSGGAGQDHKTSDVISFCKGRLRPEQRVDLPGAHPHPPAGARESEERLRVEYSPPPPSYAHAHSCAVQTPVYTSVHPLSGSHHTSWCTHARTRGPATPTRQPPSPHPSVHTSSMVPRALPPTPKDTPLKVYWRCQAAKGGTRRSWAPLCMLMNSLIISTARTTPPGRQLLPGARALAGFLGRAVEGSACALQRFRESGSLASPSAQCPRGPAGPLTTCSLLLLRLPFQEAGRLQQRLYAHRAESGRGRAGAEAAAREPSTGQAGGPAGGRDHLRGATGLGGAAHSSGKTGGARGEKSMSPRIFAK